MCYDEFMKKALITLDFDGVISPIDNSYDFSSDKLFVEMKLGGFSCFIKQEVLTFMERLSLNPNIKVMWASSWDDMTQFFNTDSGGSIPHLPYIMTAGMKAERILETASELDVEELHIFEDSAKVRNRVNHLRKKSPEKYPFNTVFHKTDTAKGISSAMISSVERQIFQ